MNIKLFLHFNVFVFIISDEGKSVDWLSLSSYKVTQDNDKQDSKPKKIKLDVIDDIRVPDDDSKKHKRHSKSHSSSKSSSKSSHSSSKSHSELPSSESKGIYESLKKKIFIEDTGLAPEHAFIVDPRPDKNNFAFKSLYNLHVAKYERTFNICKDEVKRKKKLTKNTRYYFTKAIKYLNENKNVFDYSKPKQRFKQEPFIPVENNKLSSVKCSSANPLGVYDAATTLYIQGKGLDEAASSRAAIEFTFMKSDAGTESDQRTVGPPIAPTTEQIIYNKTQEFNKWLRENPSDIDKWIEFVNFQDELSSEKIDGKLEVAVWEKKLSVIEKALESNPKCVRLSIEKLKILANLWEPDKVNSEWKQLTFIYPNSILVWYSHIQFSKTQISYFSQSKTSKIYQKLISIMNKMNEGTFMSHSPPERLPSEMIAVITSYCQFIKEIGYMEKAIAIWQAQIEFNCFVPDILIQQNSSFQEYQTFFEPFWDSGVPRFGEDGAQGWEQVMAQKITQESDLKNLDQEENQIIKTSNSKSIAWLKFELLRQAYHWVSVKAQDEVDDPERNILFDDVNPFLFKLKNQDEKFELILRFLKFLNVQIDNELLTKSVFTEDKHNHFLDSESQINKSLELEIKQSFVGLEKFITNIFNSSIKLFDEEKRFQLILIHLNYEQQKLDKSKSKLNEYRKLVKSYLKQQQFRNNLKLWSIYAGFEWKIVGNQSEGRKTYQMAIQMMVKSTPKQEFLSFVLEYVKLELKIEDLNNIKEDFFNEKVICDDKFLINVLLTGALQEPVTQPASNQLGYSYSSVQILKAKNFLAKQNDLNSFLCLVLITYLTNGINQASDLLEEQLALCDEVKEKQIYIYYLELLLLNLRRNYGVPLLSVYKVVQRALERFSYETRFLNLLIHLELKSSIFGRVRNFFGKTFMKSGQFNSQQYFNLVSYSIYYELKRLGNIKGNMILLINLIIRNSKQVN